MPALSLLTLLLSGIRPAAAEPAGEHNLDSDADASFEGAISSATVGDKLGHAIAVGDLNGDGLDDLILGAPGMDMVHVFFGPVSGADDVANADLHFQGEPGGEAGWAVAVGDLTGDGYDDLVVAEPSALNGSGLVSVLFGPLSSQVGWYDSNSSEVVAQFVGATASHLYPSWYAGWSLNIGDFDADGDADLVVGACGASDIETDPVRRSAGGVFFVSNQDIQWGGKLSLLDATTRIWGLGTSGCSLASGDTNGDGIDDIVFGSPQLGLGSLGYAGAVTVVEGREAWPADIRLATYYPTYLTPNLVPDVWTVYSDSDGRNLGDSVATADFNGDGIAEVLVGAPADENAPLGLGGAAFLIYGAEDASGLEGVSMLLDVAAASFEGAFDSWTGYSVASAGDLDGDETDDLLIGSALSESYLFYGVNEPGFQVSYSCSVSGCRASIPSHAELAGSFDIGNAHAIFYGPQQTDYAGLTVAGVGDVTNDGVPDIAISGPRQQGFTGRSHGPGATWVLSE